ncbi:heme-binding protein, partial [Acinetobacter baumannii]
DPRVTISDVPGSVSAVLRFRGGWSEAAFEKHREALTSAIAAAGLTPVGSPRFARFDPPFMPAFLRHTEVVQDIEAAARRADA